MNGTKAKELPSISVVIPVYNAETVLRPCLESIRKQDCPQDQIEILVVDDDSSDGSVEIARSFGATVLHNGNRNIEMGKSIGLQRAQNEMILLMDADNILPSDNWISRCVTALQENPEAVGAEAIWFRYDRNDLIADRYCSLFGINDPMAFYLNRRDRLMATEKKWKLPGRLVKETSDYFLVEFNKDNLLTVGSQGFLTRKELLLQTNYRPYLFHMDSNMELVERGYCRFVMMKLDIIHLHSPTIRQFLRKLERNMRLFLLQRNLRKYRWEAKPSKLFLVILIMTTGIVPLCHSIRGFVKKHDIAWFLHPFLCLIVPTMYGLIAIRHGIAILLRR